MSKPIVAIIGRPNTGKSTLFNRLLKRKQAIVDETEGITRDRIYGEVEWCNSLFTLIDTGGYIPDEMDIMVAAVRNQAELAVNEANLLLFMVDARTGVTPMDTELMHIIRNSNKPCILVVNKIDNTKQEILKTDFYSLGIDTVVTISALHGRNTGDLLDEIIHNLGKWKPVNEEEREEIRIAIIGMPNVGKSSITNALIHREKSIVTEIPGTTRDAIDSRVKYYGKTYVLVDTAGLRKKSRLQDNIEYYSMLRTYSAIEKSHVALVVLDGVNGFRKQDQQIVRRVLDKGRGLVLVVNKWDLVLKDDKIHERYKKAIRRLFKSMEDYPIQFVSAKTRQRISNLLPESEQVYQLWNQKISTSKINRVLRSAINQYHTPAVRGKHIKIKYATQVTTAPPRFAFFSNFPELIPISYKNYLENKFREEFDLKGVPIRLSFRKSD